MEKLIITAQLKVPIILGGGYLTFDALLASLIFERTGDIEVSHTTVPLVCTDGLFHASAALFEHFGSTSVAFVANLRATHALDPDLILKNKHGDIHKQIGLTRRRDFGAVMNSYTSFDAPEFTWYAEGDRLPCFHPVFPCSTLFGDRNWPVFPVAAPRPAANHLNYIAF
jgi:hypothetical protein